MSNNPEVLRSDIEATRSRLSEDVNDLSESVNPKNVARRSANRTIGRVGALRDHVMGAASDAQESGAGAVHNAADMASSVPDMARSQARGNPLAAGAVALAAGWLLGSLMPASQRERELTSTAREQAQPLVEEAKTMAKDTAQELKDPAKEAVDSVKQTASSGVEEVKGEGASAVQNVKESGSSSSGATGP
jgi:ElaB/YqjD/DUF883 family membrane-anchored ribosome-binding protein